MNDVLKWALKYRSWGWSVIPIPKGRKSPNIKWREYQTRLPTVGEIYKWFQDPQQSIGIMTGPLSNLSVWDVDAESSPLSRVAARTRRGCHSYFLYDDRVKTLQEVQNDTDTRSKGGIVVAPPSEGYKWLDPNFTPRDLPPFPDSLLPRRPANDEMAVWNKRGWIGDTLNALNDGMPRTPRLLKLIGRLHFDKYSADDILTIIAPYARLASYDIGTLRKKIEEIITNYENKKATEGQGQGIEVHSPGDKWEHYKRFRDNLLHKTGVPEISTGFSALDSVLSGFRRGELYTIGARTGIGKTSLCINICKTVLKQGKRVLFLSTEMSYLSIWHRLGLDDSELKNSLLFTSDISSPTRAQVERLINDTNPDIVIFDHIQHIGTVGSSRYLELSSFVKALKDIARNSSIPVVCASQLNRSADFVDKQGVKQKPQLYHLKECGTIEEESTVVILLSKDSALDEHTDAYTLSVQKNRFGLCKDISVNFNKATGEMVEL